MAGSPVALCFDGALGGFRCARCRSSAGRAGSRSGVVEDEPAAAADSVGGSDAGALGEEVEGQVQGPLVVGEETPPAFFETEPQQPVKD